MLTIQTTLKTIQGAPFLVAGSDKVTIREIHFHADQIVVEYEYADGLQHAICVRLVGHPTVYMMLMSALSSGDYDMKASVKEAIKTIEPDPAFSSPYSRRYPRAWRVGIESMFNGTNPTPITEVIKEIVSKPNPYVWLDAVEYFSSAEITWMAALGYEISTGSILRDGGQIASLHGIVLADLGAGAPPDYPTKGRWDWSTVDATVREIVDELYIS